MPRILAIDYGVKRTGLAVTDPLKIIATALTTVDTPQLISYLSNYFQKETVEEVIIGMPRKLDNTDSSNAPAVRQFIQLFQSKFPNHPLREVDERFTSSIAQRAMIDGGMKKSERRQKGNVDQISAVLILQDYLQQRR